MSEFKIVVEQAKAWLWERMGASGLEFGASQAGAFSCPPTSQARGPVGCATRFQARCSQWLSEGTLPRRHILSKTTDPSSICPCFLHALPQKKKKKLLLSLGATLTWLKMLKAQGEKLVPPPYFI